MKRKRFPEDSKIDPISIGIYLDRLLEHDLPSADIDVFRKDSANGKDSEEKER